MSEIYTKNLETMLANMGVTVAEGLDGSVIVGEVPERRMTEDEKEFQRLRGRFFGFPVCCIENFIRRVDEDKGQDLHSREQLERGGHSGFIPCPSCARIDLPLDALLQNRIAPWPLLPVWEGFEDDHGGPDEETQRRDRLTMAWIRSQQREKHFATCCNISLANDSV